MRCLIAFLLLLGFANPAAAKWIKAETPHFIGFSDGSETDLREDMLRLERYDTLLRKRLGIEDDLGQVRLTIFFVRGIDSVQKLYGGKDHNVAGFYTASAEGAIAVVPRASGNGDQYSLSGDTILFHEYAHHLMFQYFQAAYPAWYVEGFAEYMSTAEFEKDGKAKIGIPAYHRAYGLGEGYAIPIKKLLTASVEDLRRDDQDPFYGRAWLAVHFFTFTKERRGQMGKYLDLVSKGMASIDAATQTFGDLAKLNKELDTYLMASRLSYMSTPESQSAPNTITVTALSEGEGAAMPYRIAMTRGTPHGLGEPQAVAMRKIADKYPQDPAVLTLLSEAEHDAGHWQASIDAADAALKLSPALSRALLWRGEGMIQLLSAAKEVDADKWKAARKWIIQANRASTEEATPLVLYYASYLRQGVAMPDLAVDGLHKALALVPQEDGIRLMYVMALAHQKKFTEAFDALAPLSNSPHGGENRDAVRKLADQIKKAQATGDGSLIEEPGDKDGDEKKPK
jgi:tetratricopeptide (TPR) repeat protein